MYNAIIEISKGSNMKYEYDKDAECLRLDRILHNSNVFPYNYGYIPGTLSDDGDPLDIIILCDYPIQPGAMVSCKILGGIMTTDESGGDHKILAVLSDKCDPKSVHFIDVDDINPYTLECIRYFLEHYKDGEKNKFIKLGESYGREEALRIIYDSEI
jgi:inorganic pyrophosphatase